MAVDGEAFRITQIIPIFQPISAFEKFAVRVVSALLVSIERLAGQFSAASSVSCLSRRVRPVVDSRAEFEIAQRTRRIRLERVIARHAVGTCEILAQEILEEQREREKKERNIERKREREYRSESKNVRD